MYGFEEEVNNRRLTLKAGKLLFSFTNAKLSISFSWSERKAERKTSTEKINENKMKFPRYTTSVKPIFRITIVLRASCFFPHLVSLFKKKSITLQWETRLCVSLEIRSGRWRWNMQKKTLKSANFRLDMCRKCSVFESLLRDYPTKSGYQRNPRHKKLLVLVAQLENTWAVSHPDFPPRSSSRELFSTLQALAALLPSLWDTKLRVSQKRLVRLVP